MSPYWHEIVKYAPQYYKDGIYTKDEWYTICQLGEFCDGKKFEIVEYLETVEKYVDTAIDIMKFLNIKYLSIYNTFLGFDSMGALANLPFGGNVRDVFNYNTEGKRVPLSKMPPLIRLAFENPFSFHFVNHSKDFYLRFGFDCYMHVFTKCPNRALKVIVEQHGLYLDPR